MSVDLRVCAVCFTTATTEVDGTAYCHWCAPDDPLEARMKAAIADHYRAMNPHLPERNQP